MRGQEWRRSRSLVLFVVMVALFLDAMLVTVILPIVPDYLNKMRTHSVFSDEITVGKTNNSFNQDDSGSAEIGLLFASKAFMQLLVGPFVGALTNRIGYTKPMFAGFLLMFISTLTYAFANTYALMLTARAVQGIGSSLSSIAGLAMLSQWYPDDKERGIAMSIAFAGTGLGVMVGPIFGGFFNQYFGKEVPFFILATFALFDGGLRLLILEPNTDTTNKIKSTSLITLLKDPYILLSAGAIFLANTGIAILEPLLPIRLIQTMQANSLEQGIAFVPISLAFFVGLNIFGRVSYWIGRYRAAILGFLMMGCWLIVIPFARNLLQLIIPNAGLGLAISIVESSMLPFMAYLIDVRHSGTYGNVYAITDTAFCLAFFIGPTFGGFLMNHVGFEWTLRISAVLCFLYAPVLTLLRNPAAKEEIQPLVSGNTK